MNMSSYTQHSDFPMKISSDASTTNALARGTQACAWVKGVKVGVELQVLGSVTEMTFLGCIETLVTDMRGDTSIHAHKD